MARYFPEEVSELFDDKDKWIKMFVYMLLVMVLLYSCTECNGYLGLPNDHPVEQMAEHVIKENTGLDVDLTPESPE